MRLLVLFLSLALAALAAGMAKLHPVDWTVWSFAIFFGSLRIKEFLDDAYVVLEMEKNLDKEFWIIKVGFFLGIASWFLWVLAAYNIDNISMASRYLFVAVLISTIYVIISAVVCRSEKKYAQWLIANFFYLSLLFYCSRIDPDAHRVRIGVSFIMLFLIVIIDFLTSKSHRVLSKLREI